MTDATLTRETFRDRLRALSTPTFARLVADLWERRGRSVAVEGRRVRVGRGATERTLLVSRDGDDPDWRGVDRAVTDGTVTADAIPVPVTTPDDLFEFARYALDRSDCQALFAEHFDARPPERRPPPGELPPREDPPTGDESAVPADDSTAPRASGEGGEAGGRGRGGDATRSGSAVGERSAAAGRDTATDSDETADERADDAPTRDSGRSNGRVVGGALVVLVVLGLGAAAAGGLGVVVPGGTDAGLDAGGGATTAPDDAGEQGATTAPDDAEVAVTATAATGTPAATTAAETPTTTATATPTATATVDESASYLSLKPTCDRPPRLVVAVQLGIFREAGENPRRAARAAWPFLSPLAQQFLGTARDYGRILESDVYAPLLGHEEVTYGPSTRTNRTVVQPVTVVANGSEASYEFVVSKTGGDDTGAPTCWRVANVSRLDDPATNASDAGRDSVPGVGPVGGRPAAVGVAAP